MLSCPLYKTINFTGNSIITKFTIIDIKFEK
jgi:hypothetical protein